MLALLLSAQLQEAECPQPVSAGASADASLLADDGHTHELSGKGLWIGGTSFGADDIASATPELGGLSPSDWIVALTFTKAGNAKFIAAQHCRLGRQIEISFDGHVIAAPVLNTYITGERADIYSGPNSQADAAAMAAAIMRVRDGAK
ncbi:MAG: hypothetical protein ABIS51_03790 [Sphingomonas sp.]